VNKKTRKYDLEDRTYQFAQNIIELCKALPKNIINNPFISQLLRSGNSQAANYIEADEALSKKDFIYRMRVSRKEQKESVLHLKSLLIANPTYKTRILGLIDEARQLIRIFSSIIEKSK